MKSIKDLYLIPRLLKLLFSYLSYFIGLMGFSAYILETLKKYGMVDLGPLGSFRLNYSPSRWQVARQDFDVPFSQLKWSPPLLSTEPPSYGPLSSVIAGLHDIPYDKAVRFCTAQIETYVHDLDTNNLDLNPIGIIYKDKKNNSLEFIEHESLDRFLKFEPLKLQKLNAERFNNNTFQWWLVIASALMLGTIFFLIDKAVVLRNNIPVILPQTTLDSFPGQTATMHTNMAPWVQDSISAEATKEPAFKISSHVVVVTGTFCKARNVQNMKTLIGQMHFELYEENLHNGCIRLGVTLPADKNLAETLQVIRNKIEPSAWILEQ